MKQTEMRKVLYFRLFNTQVVNLNYVSHSKNMLIICNEPALQDMA